MKVKTLLSVCFLLAHFYVLGQKKDFEGEIIFAQTVSSKTTSYTSEQLKQFYGDTIIITIKEGNYRHKVLNSIGFTDIIYLSNQNRWYYKLARIDTLYYIDCSKEFDKVINLLKITDTVNVLGYHCRALTIKTENNTATYFYSDSLYKDPSYFSHHKFNHYNAFLNETKSIYLRQLISTQLLDGEITAINIEQKSISDETFILPDLPIKEQ